MFRGEEAKLKGSLPLELPHGQRVEGRLEINDDTTITISFEDADLASEIMIEALRGHLMGLTLGYTAVRPKETDVIDEPWDEIVAARWPRIQRGELTIKGAYDEHDQENS